MKVVELEVKKMLRSPSDKGGAIFTATVRKENDFNDKKFIVGEAYKFVCEHPNGILDMQPGDRAQVSVIDAKNADKNEEPHFVVDSIVSYESCANYVMRCFLAKHIPGMDMKLATELTELFGAEAISGACRCPEALMYLGLSNAECDVLCEKLKHHLAFQGVLSALMCSAADTRLAPTIYEKYGALSDSLIQAEPYRAFYENVIDFTTADRLYLHYYAQPESLERCCACIWACIHNFRMETGSNYVEREQLPQLLNNLHCGRDEYDDRTFVFPDRIVDDALNDLSGGYQRIIVDSSAGAARIYPCQAYSDERTITERLAAIMRTPKNQTYNDTDIVAATSQFEKDTGIGLTAAQKRAVFTALKSPVVTITGGPGTGKTLTLQAIVSAMRAFDPSIKIASCAPTGVAAQKLQSVTGVTSSTIHRLLGINSFLKEGTKQWLNCDTLVVDEASMLDSHMSALLLQATPATARLILVGDPNQLKSVQPGNVLGDIIESGVVPLVTLEKTIRQGDENRIVRNAKAILAANEDNAAHLVFDGVDGNFSFCQADHAYEIRDDIVNASRLLHVRYGLAYESMQVLTPVNSGPLGTAQLNRYLQCHLNHQHKDSPCIDFKLGDKVLQCANDYKLSVFNGNIGYVSAIGGTKNNYITVRFDDREVKYTRRQAKNLTLGYAITVHKSQGSEYDTVIIPLDISFGRALTKRLFYTAITRAKNRVLIIGSKEAVRRAIFELDDAQRMSQLPERLRDAIAQSPTALPCIASTQLLSCDSDSLQPKQWTASQPVQRGDVPSVKDIDGQMLISEWAHPLRGGDVDSLPRAYG